MRVTQATNEEPEDDLGKNVDFSLRTLRVKSFINVKEAI